MEPWQVTGNLHLQGPAKGGAELQSILTIKTVQTVADIFIMAGQGVFTVYSWPSLTEMIH